MLINLKRVIETNKIKRNELADLLNVGESDISKRVYESTTIKESEKLIIFKYLRHNYKCTLAIEDLFMSDNIIKEKKKKKKDSHFSDVIEILVEDYKKESKQSLSTIANGIGVDTKTLKHWIDGDYIPRSNEIYDSIAKFFDVPISTLKNKVIFNLPYSFSEDVDKQNQQKEILNKAFDLLFEYMDVRYGFKLPMKNEIYSGDREKLRDTIWRHIIDSFQEYDKYRETVEVNIDFLIMDMENRLSDLECLLPWFDKLDDKFDDDHLLNPLLPDTKYEREKIEHQINYLKTELAMLKNSNEK